MPNDWTYWQTALTKSLQLSHTCQLANQLIDWSDEDKHYQWFYQESTTRLFERTPTGWRYYPKATARSSRNAIMKFRDPVPTPTLPQSAVRASVEFQGNTICLKATSHRQANPTPEESQATRSQPTLDSAIASLSPGAAWALAHWTSSDDGSTLAAAIRDGTAIAVADGSFKNKFGTASLVLEGLNKIHRLTANMVIPGEPNDHSAYRSELGGLFGIVVLVHCICITHHITSGSITVGCDGQSALWQAMEHEGDVNPTSQQFDLIAAVRQWKKKCPITWHSRHVPGHQDDSKTATVLDRWATLNCEMDLNAKAHWQRHHTQPSTQRAIEGEPWQLELPDGKVCRDFRGTLHEHIFGPKARAYWEGKSNRFHDGNADDVDWEAAATGRKSMTQARRQWQTKHNTGFCAVGKMMQQRKEQTTAKCPRCNTEVEDAEHVLKCTGSGATEKWQEQILELKKHLIKQDTGQEVRKALLAGLQTYREGTDCAHPTTDPEVQQVIERQNKLGWRNLLEGFPAVGWAEAQQKAFTRAKSKRTGK